MSRARDMVINIKNILKIFGVSSLFIVAVGILIISLESVQLKPEYLLKDYHPMTIYMKDLSMNYSNKK